MNELPGKYMHQEISNRIIRGYYDVFDGLTHGLPESAYHRALHIALNDLGLNFETQVDLPVYFRGQLVGRYRCDLVVEQKVIVEIKTAPRIVDAHRNQLIGYLKISKLQVGQLVIFGPEPEFERCFRRSDNETRPKSQEKSEKSEGN